MADLFMIPDRRVLTIGNPGLEIVSGKGQDADKYIKKVLSYSPIAYWPLTEKSGTVAACRVNAAQNGTYNSDVSGWLPGTGIGDGHTAPFFDGNNDYVNIYSATFNAAMLAGAVDEGTAIAWCKVAAGAWTDGIERRIVSLYDNADNAIYIQKHDGNDLLRNTREANNVIKNSYITVSSALWVPLAFSWSIAVDEQRAYINGAQPGATINGLQAWTGAGLTATRTAIGMYLSGNRHWHGHIAHCAFFNTPLSPAVIADLAAL